MSLLDDVSIVVTPNGYKAGELYAVVPVPTEGAEEVTDGNFPSPNTSWSLSGWEILGNLAKNSVDGAGNNLYQGSVTSVNQLFKVVITTTITAGSVKVMLGGGTGGYNEIGEATSTGTFTYYGTSFGTDNRILLQTGTGSVIGSVQLSNISVKEYTSADMDVTRATAGTRVDENGLVNYAEVIGSELITNGDFATDSDWTKVTGWSIANGVASCDGTQTSGTYITQTGLTFTNAKTYKVTYTVTVSAGNISTRLQGSGATVTGTSKTSSGTYTDYLVSTGNTSFRIRGNDAFIGTVDNVSVKEVTRDNVPRIDYTGGGCPHILAEPMRTNLFPYSEDFSQWVNISSTDTPNYSTAPDGTNTATRLLTSSQDSSYLYVSSLTISDATPYTLSIYVKSNGNGLDDFRLYTTTGGTSANLTATTEWQRFDCNLTSTTTSTNIGIRGVGGQDTDVLVWGAQVEEGSYATSYIPNFGTALGVTRNQDIFTRDGIGSLINSTEGVLFAEIAALANDGTFRMIGISDGTIDNVVNFYYRTDINKITIRLKSGATQEIFESFDITATNFNKVAFRYKSGESNLFINGVKQKVSDYTATNMPVGLSQLTLDSGGNTNFFYGKVKQLQVYDTSLSDEQLAALTS